MKARLIPPEVMETPEEMAHYAIDAFLDGLIKSKRLRKDVLTALTKAKAEGWEEGVIACDAQAFKTKSDPLLSNPYLPKEDRA